MVTKKNSVSWSDVKTKLADFDRAGLLGLLQDLYAANKDNQTFLHARLNLGDDVLKPYKTTINRWLCPDVLRNQDFSIAKAKKSIADYKKAIGQAEGLAELMVFYCERATGFIDDVSLQDEGYFDALVRMFEQALKTIASLANSQRPPLWDRLDAVRRACRDLGYGVDDDMEDLLAEYRADD
ncbi:MAG: hypothetical protein Q8L97_03110 [Nitrosomonas sp.]|uniref:hypothetical protein n=1 Tax=Nitrosomonas sp. TaxID=42353 RepID=UPI002731DFE7|nr:hypothetical protein [Nitrosomonas sp.]MDP1549140.1 hypothetical protein [Nitrosomonas sp.]